LLSIFPFEREWYARRVPGFPVEFVGHPLLDRYAGTKPRPAVRGAAASPELLLLPGSRASELARHLPVMLGALAYIRAAFPGLRARMVLPGEGLLQQAKAARLPDGLEVQTGRLAEALLQADMAIASTGTVTLECAFFGVPTVALYQTSFANYQIAKRIVKVKYLSMPNLLADESIFPEFIQDAATAENLSRAAIELLREPNRQAAIRIKLSRVVASLGGPGASRRAAQAIVRLIEGPPPAR
jgi:lipid-A-disaccharide synthase